MMLGAANLVVQLGTLIKDGSRWMKSKSFQVNWDWRRILILNTVGFKLGNTYVNLLGYAKFNK